MIVALAAPKLFPLLDTMSKFPRTVYSREYLDPISLVRTFTSTESDRAAWPFWQNQVQSFAAAGLIPGPATIQTMMNRA